jgi:hypothetical protein
MITTSTISSVAPGEPCIVCLHCGRYCRPQDKVCPQCHETLVEAAEAATRPLNVRPLAVSAPRRGTTQLAPNTGVLFQVLPSSAQFWLSLEYPVTLGRTTLVNRDDLLDLTDLDGYRLGISRRHCRLERRDTRLALTDLGSANGTYLNGEPLVPHQVYLVADGDQLILGMLHLTIFFRASG